LEYSRSQIGGNSGRRVLEICTCGHPIVEHFGGICRVNNSNCNCRLGRPIFVVVNPESFYKPHTSVGLGHALIQGVLHHQGGLEGIELSTSDIGRNPECYRCRRYTVQLMPILVNRHSVQAVSDVSKGKMTRLWCNSCCELEGMEFIPYVHYAIEAALRRRIARN